MGASSAQQSGARVALRVSLCAVAAVLLVLVLIARSLAPRAYLGDEPWWQAEMRANLWLIWGSCTLFADEHGHAPNSLGDLIDPRGTALPEFAVDPRRWVTRYERTGSVSWRATQTDLEHGDTLMVDEKGVVSRVVASESSSGNP